ncbi:alpha-glucosidase [Prauserella shujinwangii]|uniref:Alpha-glucosidase n=1 Tax=Prauserella shujinwangii TaxID=1453103 RepID=A0A2T0LMV6_9PSEU|nr:glycoside hydrolase family 13 protein [Prauserella shujinwangii]PRX44515.1 alpha-glucosidase [Prauserella shujinwangii]
MTRNSGWWRSAVIYQIYVRSFADANGDGVGDLAGIRARLDHLSDLGVDALWVTPFYTSPMADGGYDVADYRAVDPLFGDLDEAKGLVADAHARGLRVIVDVVPNHTSAQHPWFVEALAADPGSPARARYLFRDGTGPGGAEPPNDWESVFGGPAWTRVPDGQWYLHLFDPAQPDLNWENPEVHEEFADILRFWLDLGVDGVRIDVAHGMVKADGLPDTGRTEQIGLLGHGELPYFDQDGVHEIYREWRKILDSYPGERIGVAEAWAPNAERLALYLRPDELHQAFNFHYVKAEWSAERFRDVIDESLAAVNRVGAPSTWVLSNHDIERHVTRFGGGETGLRRARAAALLTFALPGSTYVYQGEELGLPEVTDLPEEVLTDPKWIRSGHTERGRDGCRVPLPWSGSEPPFGFGASSWLPQPADWAKLTVEAQRADPGSTLSLYRSAIRLRRDLPDAPLRWVDAGGDRPDVLMFRRGPGFACTVNFGSASVTLPRPGRLLLASTPTDEIARTDQTVTLPPDAAAWWTGDADD